LFLVIPVSKQPLQNRKEIIDKRTKLKRKESFLFSGSTVIHIKSNVQCRGAVVSIGFSTSKGELFRSILYPRVIPFKMVSDSYRVLAALAVIAAIGAVQRVCDAYVPHTKYIV